MLLSRARGEYWDETICDLAEVYHILSPDELSPSLLATLVYGLPDDSRLFRAMSGRRANSRDLLIAAAVDRLTTLVWFKTKDGAKGRNRPASIVDRMTREDENPEKQYSVPADELAETIRRIRES